MRTNFEGGSAPVIEQGANLEKKDSKDPIDALLEYLQLAATMYDHLSFWKSKGDKKIRSLVRDADDDRGREYPYTISTSDEIKDKTTSLELSIDMSVGFLAILIKRLLKSDDLSQLLEDKFGKKVRSLNQAKDIARELIEPFYDQYSRHLRANGGKGKRTRDAMSSDESAWDVAAIDVPSGVDIMDNDKLQVLQNQRKSFEELVKKLSLLPGPHQKFAKLLAEGQGTAQDVNLLLNSYAFGNNKGSLDFGKLDFVWEQEDLKKLMDLITKVTEFNEEIQQKLGIEIPFKPECASLEQAREIMAENFYGSARIKKAFGFEVPASEIPDIPYSPAELQRAKALGERLVLRVSPDDSGQYLTMKKIIELAQPRLIDDYKLQLYNVDRHQMEDFYQTNFLKTEWRLISGSFVAGSTNQNYLHQTRLLRDHLKALDFLSKKEESDCSDEILQQLSEQMGVDWNKQEIIDQNKYTANWREVTRKIVELLINQNHRRTPSEIIYDWVLEFSRTKDIGLFKKNFDWTSCLSSSGHLVYIGCFVSDGMSVDGSDPNDSDNNIGVVSQR